MFDDESGYDLRDPKHPTYAERMFDRADERRKREREEPPQDFPGIPAEQADEYERETHLAETDGIE